MPQSPVYCVFIFNNKISPPSGGLITENDADTHKSRTKPKCQKWGQGEAEFENKQDCHYLVPVLQCHPQGLQSSYMTGKFEYPANTYNYDV